MDSADFQYGAFISYSRQDSRWAKWLHRCLESYRIPPDLRKNTSSGHPHPARFSPIFLDQAELPASADLGASLRNYLEKSRYLIVICSPHAAKSQWVNEEVAHFQRLGRSAQLLCLIVDGEPNAAATPDRAAQECFPPAIRTPSQLDRELAPPLAADARPGHDTRADALLRILAALLGVGYDTLKKREHRRRRHAILTWTLSGGAVVAVVGATFLHLEQRRRTEQAQHKRDQLVENGLQELRRHEPARALPYFSAAYTAGPADPTLRFLLAEALRPAEALELHRTTTGKTQILWTRLMPGGTEILAGCADQHARVQDIRSGQDRREMGPLARKTALLAFDRENRHMACGDDTKLTLWNTATGVAEHRLKGHLLTVLSLVFSPDGQTLASASADNSAILWDVASGTRKRTLEGHTASATTVQFSPGGTLVATGSADETVKLWDVKSGDLLRTVENLGGTIGALDFSPDGLQLAVQLRTGDVVLVDVDSGRILARNPSGTEVLATCLKAGAPTALAAVTRKGGETAWLVDLQTGQNLGDLRGPLTSAQFSPDHRQVLTTGRGRRTMELCDALTGAVIMPLQTPASLSPLSAALQDAAFATTGERVVTVSTAGDVDFWRTGRSRPLALGLTPEWATSAHFTRSGQAILITYPHRIVVCDTHSGQILDSWEPEDFKIEEVAADREAQRIAARNWRGQIQLWKRGNASVLPLTGRAVEFSPDDKTAALVREDGSVALIAVATGQVLAEVPVSGPGTTSPAPTALAFSQDGTRLLLAGKRIGAHLLAVPGFQKLWAMPPESFDSFDDAVLSPDGGKVLLTGKEGHLWDANKNRLIARLPSHALFGITNKGFSRDGRWAYTAGGDGIARIWEAESGTLKASLNCEGHFVNSVSFHPHGEFVLTSAGNQVQIWALDRARMLAIYDGLNAEFSPDGSSILVQRQQPALLDFRLEDRPPAAIISIMQATSPWRLQDDQLVATKAASLTGPTPPPVERIVTAPMAPR